VTDEERASEINHFQELADLYYQQNVGLITINPLTAAQRMMDNMSMGEQSSENSSPASITRRVSQDE
jgi:succinyl-CoA synthetase beta subunit